MPFLLTTFERQVKAIWPERSKAGVELSREWTPAAGALIFSIKPPSRPDAREHREHDISPTDKKIIFLI
jgi:hypothetical protein